jgi:hypothetical protein
MTFYQNKSFSQNTHQLSIYFIVFENLHSERKSPQWYSNIVKKDTNVQQNHNDLWYRINIWVKFGDSSSTYFQTRDPKVLKMIALLYWYQATSS